MEDFEGVKFFLLCFGIVFFRFFMLLLVPDNQLTPAGKRMRGRILKFFGEENLPPIWFRKKGK